MTADIQADAAACEEAERQASISLGDAVRARQRERQIRRELNEIFEVALKVYNAIMPIDSTPPPQPTTGDIKDALWEFQAVWWENYLLRKELEELKESIQPTSPVSQ